MDDKKMTLRVRPSTSHFFEIIGGKLRFAQRANSFLSAIATRGVSSLTIRAYAYDIVFAGRWLTASKRHVKSLTIPLLIEFVAYQRKLDASPQSINRRLVTVGLFYQFCYDRDIPGGIGTTKPARHHISQHYDSSLGLIKIRRNGPNKLRVKVPRELIEPLEPAEVNRFFTTVKRYRDVAITMLMLLCGLRCCEILALRIGDLALAQRRIVVRGKGNKQRMIPIVEHTVRAIENYLRLERPDSCQTNRLFVILQGPQRSEPMTASGLRSLFRHRRLSQKLGKANPHRFRHTFGADMARSGVSLPVLQRMMGHANGQTTLRYINLCADDVVTEYHNAMKRIQERYDRPTN